MKAILSTMILLAPVALAGKPLINEHSYHSVGKQGAAVQLMDAPRYEVTVGETVPLDLRFALGADAQNVRVELNADGGLALDQTLLRFEMGAHDKDVVTLPTVNVAVTDEGRSSVNVTVYITRDGAERFKSFSVPFSTPAAKAVDQSKLTLKSDANGQQLRVMKARETN